ncbi:MAG: hypothetical protein MJZ16_02820 [Bacteroidales bacterium]|nr:hypothetical protein [Bacteroidales bacterium]
MRHLLLSLFIVVLSTALYSCDNGEEPPVINESPQSNFQKNFYELTDKNSGCTGVSFSGGDIYYWKDHHLCYQKWDVQEDVLLETYVSHAEVPDTVLINQGYGKYEEWHLNDLSWIQPMKLDSLSNAIVWVMIQDEMSIHALYVVEFCKNTEIPFSDFFVKDVIDSFEFSRVFYGVDYVLFDSKCFPYDGSSVYQSACVDVWKYSTNTLVLLSFPWALQAKRSNEKIIAYKYNITRDFSVDSNDSWEVPICTLNTSGPNPDKWGYSIHQVDAEIYEFSYTIAEYSGEERKGNVKINVSSGEIVE